MFHDLNFLHKVWNSSYDTPELLSELNLRVPSFHSRDKSLFYVQNSRVNVSRNSTLRRSTKTFTELFKNNEVIDLSMSNMAFQRSLRSELL